MKTYLGAVAILILATFSPLEFVLSQSDDTIGELPGHDLGVTEAIRRSSDITVGTLTSVGMVDDGPPGVLEYSRSRLQATKTIKGNLKGAIDCSYKRVTFPKSNSEIEPIVGIQYIFFLKYRGEFLGHGLYAILRFLPYSDANVKDIQKRVEAHESHISND